jgi:hypothetical protein
MRPADVLGQAKAFYEEGDYTHARDLLVAFLRSDKHHVDELREAHTYLAASYFFLGDKPDARSQLELLFRKDHFARIDPVAFPPEIVDLGDEVLKQLEHEEKAEPEVKPEPKPEPKVEVKPEPKPNLDPKPDAKPNQIIITKSDPAAPKQMVLKPAPPIALAFIPFGVGQFANEQYLKGSVFAALEVAAFAVAGYELNAVQAYKSSDGATLFGYKTLLPGHEDDFRNGQLVYLVAFWTGVGMAVGGIVDALLSRPGDELVPAPAGLTSGPQVRLKLVPNGLQVRF